MTEPRATDDVRNRAEDEVVELARDLIRIDSTNTGDTATSVGERRVAEYVGERLAEVGIESQIFESEPGRASLVARIAGTDSSRGALLVHGHLDVVPANKADWSVDPFAGEIRDGYLWGRGAVDMKDMDAMVLSLVRAWSRDQWQPPRDIVLAFLADEEAGSGLGGHWLVDNHPDLFDGCTEAISEVGGFSLTMSNDLRLYLIETAEKGINWLRLVASGRAGHGSMIHEDNAVTALAEAVARIGRHQFPVIVTDTVRRFLGEISQLLGIELDPADPENLVPKLGGFARLVGATLRNTANPTMLDAGYKANVIPGSATAVIDGRVLPGQEEEFMRTASRRWRPPSMASWSMRWRMLCAPRIPVRGRSPICSPAVRTARPSPGSASAASASHPYDSHPTSISPPCSMVWTSASRSTAYASVCAFSTGSCPAANRRTLQPGEHRCRPKPRSTRPSRR